MKEDFGFGFTWTSIFWPVFVIVAIAFVISIISIFLTLLNYFSKDRDLPLIYTNLWLIYSLLGFSFSFLLLFNTLPHFNFLFLLIPIFYLLSFLILTQKLKKKLAIAWWELFLNDQLINPAHPNLAQDQPLPLPGSQKLLIETSLTNKLAQVIKSTPRVLVRLASPRVQSKDEKLKRRKMCRTLSQAIDTNTQAAAHIRSRSSCVGTYNFDSIKANCKFCSKAEGVNKFLTCGHGELCNPCADLYLKSKRKCYVCHEQITGVVQDYSKTGATENSKRQIFGEV